MDRFLMRIHIGYPEPKDEREILRGGQSSYDAIQLNPVVRHDDVVRLQALTKDVFVEDSVLDYLLALVVATRTEADFKAGVSVRGGLALKTAAQARALLRGRDFRSSRGHLHARGAGVCASTLSLTRSGGDACALEERRAVAGPDAASDRGGGAVAGVKAEVPERCRRCVP
jgi:MoxR-like ATPase